MQMYYKPRASCHSLATRHHPGPSGQFVMNGACAGSKGKGAGCGRDRRMEMQATTTHALWLGHQVPALVPSAKHKGGRQEERK
jgi:hypothetical protein